MFVSCFIWNGTTAGYFTFILHYTGAQVDLKRAALCCLSLPLCWDCRVSSPIRLSFHLLFSCAAACRCMCPLCVRFPRNRHLPYFEAGFLTGLGFNSKWAPVICWSLRPYVWVTGPSLLAVGLFVFFNKTWVLGIKLRSSCLKDILKIIHYGLAHSPSPLLFSEGL